ncbi:hypothetical protein [Candidatus Halobonum tyrrellensis]|uniref:Uncharacterized protein n=1 Tax=Candidatus Halobonum tyrrellensis G22 TaxID=1324957 RepID=V4HE27_9EURY|nr:hypothetical protein [Candidatus Halobonum tyrrellensis]ESP88920.1 hypothetical protein K933_06538 [Candidatus Halobonum tyrrellensis G22]
MSNPESEGDITFFEYIDRLAAEKDIARDSIEYAELIEEKKPLYILTTDEFGPFERRRLAIWDVQKIIRFACDQYEDAYERALEHNKGGNTDSIPFEPAEIAEFNARYTTGNMLLLAYTLAYEFVVDLSAELARDNDLGSEQKSVSQMKKKEVTERLYEAGVIDDDLKGHIQHVANRRNELTHDIEERYLLSNFADDLVKDTARPLYAVDGLFHIKFDEHAYIPAVEMQEE